MKQIVCDRCHGQKLKCEPEGDGQGSCKRCIRAGATCTYPSYGQRWMDQIEARPKSSSVQSFEIQGMSLGRNTPPSTNLNFYPPRQRHAPPQERIPAMPSKKRQRSQLEEPWHAAAYSMPGEDDHTLIPHDALSSMATAHTDDPGSAPVDFMSPSMGAFYFDQLSSGSLLGTHATDFSNPGRDEGIMSPAHSTITTRHTANTPRDHSQRGSHQDSPQSVCSHVREKSNTMEGELEMRLCRLWCNLGYSASDTSQALVSEAFEHTKTLISIAKTYAATSKAQPSSNTNSHFDDVEGTYPQPHLLDSFGDSEQNKSQNRITIPAGDPSVIFFLLSCYARLTKLYQRLIELVLEELEDTRTPGSSSPASRGRGRSLSTTAAAGTTTAMECVQIVSSVTHLAEKLSDTMLLLEVGEDSGRGTGGLSSTSRSPPRTGGEDGLSKLIGGSTSQLARIRRSLEGSVREAKERIRVSDVL